jgi:putative hemolysin
MDETGYRVLFLIGLVVFDLIVVAARYSFSQANLVRLLSHRDQEENAIRRAVDLIRKVEMVETNLHFLRLLSWTLAVGVFLLLLIAPGAPALVGPFRWALLVVFALVLFFVEQMVEATIAYHPEDWAFRFSGFTQFWMWVLTPVFGLFRLLTRGRRPLPEPLGAVTQTELISLLDASHEEGVLEQGEREMITSIFRLDDTLASEIMVPRIDILALETNTSVPEAIKALTLSGHSRVPVYEETIDNVTGLLYAKDLLRASLDNEEPENIRPSCGRPISCLRPRRWTNCCDEMQAHSIHMAIVVDEYGGMAGLVTLEDIVEEIVGEIRDEYDQGEELPYQAVGPGEYLVQGRIDLDDLNNLMQTDLPRDEAETLSGFIYSQMGRVPENGEKITVGNLELTVEQVIGRRIRKVRARCPPEPQLFDPKLDEANADL